MALVGLVRVSTKKQETQRQHDALTEAGCVRIFEEKASGKLTVDQRPDLQEALDYMREGDLLTVQEADRLGRNLLDGLFVLTELFQRGIAVKYSRAWPPESTPRRNFLLDLALALAEDRRRDIVAKTRNGLEAARRQGRVGGRPSVVDQDKRLVVMNRHESGESIRTIAAATGLSVGTEHKTVSAAQVPA